MGAFGVQVRGLGGKTLTNHPSPRWRVHCSPSPLLVCVEWNFSVAPNPRGGEADEAADNFYLNDVCSSKVIDLILALSPR